MKKKLGYIAVLSVIIIILLWSIVSFKVYKKVPVSSFEKPVVLKIPQGSNSKQIAQYLAENGLIDSPRLFYYVARFSGKGTKLRAGRHVIQHPMSIYDLITRLSSEGGSFDIKFTVPEGWTIYQIAEILNNTFGFDTTEFYSVVKDKNLLDSLGLDAPSMEGFLYPETYLVPENYNVKQVVLKMYSDFDKMWQTKLEKAEKYGKTKEEIITLASIIEAEATTASERRTISSVYNNRLDIDMIMQADPTTIYGLRKFDKPLTLEDLRDSSLYNTYLHPGLPIGPICNPSEACIDAAMNPEETPYLYFVARDNGTHMFSKTYKEHCAAIHEIRDGRKK